MKLKQQANLIDKYLGEEKIPSFSEYVRDNEKFNKISTNFDINVEKMGKSKWGETKRFAGKEAGNRISNFHKSFKFKQKTLDKIKKEYEKKYNTKVDIRDVMEFL
jgi:hypothetical protein